MSAHHTLVTMYARVCVCVCCVCARMCVGISVEPDVGVGTLNSAPID